MKRTTKYLGSAGAFALALTPTMVAAAGTAAGVDITNTVTVNYTVGGVTQTAVAASDTFRVDQKVNLTVAWQDSSAVSGGPGSTRATTFLVTNTSNKAMDIKLDAAALATGTFTAKNLRVYRETNGTAGWQAGDTLISAPIASVAADAALTIYIVADMVEAPGTVLPDDGETANVSLTATAWNIAGSAALAQSASLATSNESGTNKTTEEVVFADAAGAAAGDVARDGKHSAIGSYVIAGARLTVSKYSYIVTDAANPSGRAIPNATVEYCIVINNAVGAAQADSVVVEDTVPTDLTYTASSIWLNATHNTTNNRCEDAGGTVGAAGVDTTNFVGGKVTNDYGSMAANTTRTLRFRATIK